MSRLLVVDDNPDIGEALKLILVDAGFVCSVLQSTTNLSQKITKFSPELIILDMMLLGVDGRDIAGKLKKHPKTAHIPILMISAHPKAQTTVLQSGADRFLAKPFDIGDLLHEVQLLLHQR